MDNPQGHSSQARAFTDVAFSRNLGIITPAEQEMLARSKAAIPGLGGVGGLHCAALARLGVGAFSLADPDIFELANFNRQYGASMRHLGQSKLDAMVEEVLQINPHLKIDAFPEGVGPANMDAFLTGVDVVVDGLDFFAFDIRRALFNRARELRIPVVTAAPLGFTASVLVFTPDGMPFDEYFDISDGLPMREKLLRFAVGLAPRGLHIKQMDPSRISLDLGRGPSLGTACLLCASLAATQAARLITGRPGLEPAPWSMQIDPLGGKLRTARPRRGNASPVQKAKLWFVRSFIVGKEGAHVHRPPQPPEPSPGDVPPRDHLAWLARAASMAPSGDNCQPWMFRIEEGRLDIFLDQEADHSFFNFRQIASVTACGAAAANVAAAAPAIGWEAQVRLLPEPDAPRLMAAIDFVKIPPSPAPLEEAVWTRRTNRRGFFKNRPMEAFCLAELDNAAGPGELALLTSREDIGKLARLVYLADRIRVERRDLHEHFMSMTRFDPPDDGDAADGLPLGNLYAGAAGEAFLRATRHWPAMRAANMIGLGRLVALHSRQAIEESPLAGLVFTHGHSDADFLAGGMALERVWLTATRLGLAFQPMTAVTLFLLRWKLEGPDSFSPAHQDLLKAVWPGLEELFPGIGVSRWPVLLFRAGYAPPVLFGTPRRDITDTLTP